MILFDSVNVGNISYIVKPRNGRVSWDCKDIWLYEIPTVLKSSDHMLRLLSIAGNSMWKSASG